MMNKAALKNYLRERAAFHGFAQVGIAKADFMEPEARRLDAWLNKGYHGNMDYLAEHFEKRVDPRKLVQGAKSVISLLFNYAPEEAIEQEDNYKIARYAYGKDYHRFVKKRVRRLLRDLESKVGKLEARFFVDSAPVLERDWAKRSGLGWIGKNTLLINKTKGSYYFLAELILDLELEYDHPIKDYCGTCTRCIDACPTDAILADGYILDSSKCISYLTIELKNGIPERFQHQMEDWIFGCDICQEVCPWNRFSTPNTESRLTPNTHLRTMRKKDWEAMSEELFDEVFLGSPIKRAQYPGLKRNINFLIQKVEQHESNASSNE